MEREIVSKLLQWLKQSLFSPTKYCCGILFMKLALMCGSYAFVTHTKKVFPWKFVMLFAFVTFSARNTRWAFDGSLNRSDETEHLRNDIVLSAINNVKQIWGWPDKKKRTERNKSTKKAAAKKQQHWNKCVVTFRSILISLMSQQPNRTHLHNQILNVCILICREDQCWMSHKTFVKMENETNIEVMK